jgi:hypothetical protein
MAPDDAAEGPAERPFLDVLETELDRGSALATELAELLLPAALFS